MPIVDVRDYVSPIQLDDSLPQAPEAFYSRELRKYFDFLPPMIHYWLSILKRSPDEGKLAESIFVDFSERHTPDESGKYQTENVSSEQIVVLPPRIWLHYRNAHGRTRRSVRGQDSIE